MKKILKMCAAALALVLALSGCGGADTVVPVVRISMLTRAGEAGDCYAGVVVSENAVEIQRDSEQTIDELLVSEGDAVSEGQVLFRYDSDELSLQLDRLELELDRLEEEIKAKKSQVADVEKELKTAKGDTKTQLNIQLRQLQTELKEAGYDQEDLEDEIKYLRQMLRNTDVTSPISGTVRSIDENADAYITIQQAGAYQVQGMLNELNMNAGLGLGSRVEILSRLDPEKIWTGMVSMVDYGNASGNSYDNLYGYTDALSSSSSYPFYVTLDSTEGLLLGQHVHIRLAGINAGSTDRVLIPENYLLDFSYDEETMITSAAVWCPDEDGRLVRQPVVLGEYIADIGSYVILEGLTLEGYVADPSNPGCREGAMTDLRSEEDFGAGAADTEPAESTGEVSPDSTDAADAEPPDGTEETVDPEGWV